MTKIKVPGLSRSIKRATGITATKRKIAKATGIPTTNQAGKENLVNFLGSDTYNPPVKSHRGITISKETVQLCDYQMDTDRYQNNQETEPTHMS